MKFRVVTRIIDQQLLATPDCQFRAATTADDANQGFFTQQLRVEPRLQRQRAVVGVTQTHYSASELIIL